MPKKSRCVEPKIGARIHEYEDDCRLGPEDRKLTIEEKAMLEVHLGLCRHCRCSLSLEAKLEFQTVLILSGFFLVEDPVRFAERINSVRKHFRRKRSYKEFKRDLGMKWLNISEEERQAVRDFTSKDC